MLEVAPPAKHASQEFVFRVVSSVMEILQRMPVDYANIPEIVAENRQGMPLYKNLDTRALACKIKEKTGTPVVVNKITVFMASKEALAAWLKETQTQYGVSGFVFVGGSDSGFQYPGPSVVEANRLAVANRCTLVGNIAIPGREHEVQRLLAKTRSGCSFFTTQVLLESANTCKLLHAYSDACRSEGLVPATFFLSFAPVREMFDLEFLKWLGVSVPKKVESRLLAHERMGTESLRLAFETFSEIVDEARLRELDVPLSVNVESLSVHNLPLAEEMLHLFSKEFEKHKALQRLPYATK